MLKSGINAAFVTATVIFLALPCGCGVFDETLDDTDATIHFDTPAAEDAIAFMHDVTILGDNYGSMDTSVGFDQTAPDAVAGDEGATGNDAASDTMPPPDTSEQDYGNSEDPGRFDAASDTNTITAIRIPCTDADTDCPEGFTCESTAKDGSFCRPPQECTLDGVTELPELISALISDDNSATIFVKVAITAETGPVTCSMEQCPPDECCRKCNASLHIADSETPIIIQGTVTSGMVNCAGFASNDGSVCGTLECKPLTPGETYVIWGSIRRLNPLELAMDGFCPFTEAASDVD